MAGYHACTCRHTTLIASHIRLTAPPPPSSPCLHSLTALTRWPYSVKLAALLNTLTLNLRTLAVELWQAIAHAPVDKTLIATHVRLTPPPPTPPCLHSQTALTRWPYAVKVAALLRTLTPNLHTLRLRNCGGAPDSGKLMNSAYNCVLSGVHPLPDVFNSPVTTTNPPPPTPDPDSLSGCPNLKEFYCSPIASNVGLLAAHRNLESLTLKGTSIQLFKFNGQLPFQPAPPDFHPLCTLKGLR